MSLPVSQPLIFGEVLFDVFDDGSQVLGGAPFNVAWHLKGFGLTPVFVSRIGNDEAAHQVLQRMYHWGMVSDGVQRDYEHITGRVAVKLVDAQPQFDIQYPAAYDFISVDEVETIFSSLSPSLLYHGSLATRAEASAQSLQYLKAKGLPTLVDLNLRSPWWNKDRVLQLVQDVAWVKLNDDELRLLSQHQDASLREQAEAFLHDHHLQSLIVTRGSQGAWLLTNNDFISSEPVKVNKMVDTVGAGDAFSAVCLLGIDKKWSAEMCLQRASAFASAICEQRGATSYQHDIYNDFMKRWQL